MTDQPYESKCENESTETAFPDLQFEECAKQAEQCPESDLLADAEREALNRLFSSVRTASSNGALTKRETWKAAGEAPDHLAEGSFERLVIDYIAWQKTSETRFADATATQGVQIDDRASETATPYRIHLASETDLIPCADIEVMNGDATAYLYSSDAMSDTYAAWSRLAEEDDDVATLVSCAREESRLYPRPLLAHSLTNAPFLLDEERIARAFEAIVQSGAYPDIETVSASNDDVYYYSTLHISSGYARALAETYSVKRFLNL